MGSGFDLRGVRRIADGDGPDGGVGGDIAGVVHAFGDGEEAIALRGPGDVLDVRRNGGGGDFAGGGIEEVEARGVGIVIDPDGVSFGVLFFFLAWRFRIVDEDGDGAAVGRDEVALRCHTRSGSGLAGVAGVPDAGGMAPGRVDSSTGGEEFYFEGMRFAAVHGQLIELGVFAAMGDEEDGAAVGHPLSAGFAALFRGGREGELAGGVLLDTDEPDVGLRAVGGGVGDLDENAVAVGGEAGLREGADVTQVFVGREVIVGGVGERDGTEAESEQGGSAEFPHGRRIAQERQRTVYWGLVGIR